MRRHENAQTLLAMAAFVLILGVILTTFVLARLSARAEYYWTAACLLLTGLAGLAVVFGAVVLFNDCFEFNIFGPPESRECVAREQDVAHAFWAAVGLSFLSVLVWVWERWTWRPAASVAAAAAAVSLVAAVIVREPWASQPPEIQANGTIGFASCDTAACWFSVSPRGIGGITPATRPPSTPRVPLFIEVRSPDGSKTAWEHLASLYLRYDGDNTVYIFGPVGFGLEIVWSPDSRYLLAYSRRFSGLDVVDTVTRTLWTASDSEMSGPAVWSPDSQHIAYVSWSGSRGGDDLHVVQRDGSHDRRLTDFVEWEITEVEWLP